MTTDKDQDLRILVLHRDSLVAPGVPSLSVSARVTEVLDYIESADGGVRYISVSETDSYAHQAVAWADVLVLSKHRSVVALELVKLAHRLGKLIIYDIDDWIFSFPSYSGGHLEATGNYSQEIIALCTYVTVANNELMKRLPDVIPGASLVFLPNGMWVERYHNTFDSLSYSKDDRYGRIIFTNADFLKVREAKDAVLTALNIFFIRHPNFVLDFYGDPFPEMFSLPFLHFTNRMPYQEYMRSIVHGDYMFAITPLGASEDRDAADFNVCKNPFKYLNYGVAGIPGIYSAAAIYQNCVKHEITGILVENSCETWLDAMEKFSQDGVLRSKVRAAAFDHINQEHHVRKSAQVFAELIIDVKRG